MASYPFADIEEKWQRFWEEESIFRTPSDPDQDRPKFYILDMFPYPEDAWVRCASPDRI